MWTDPPAASSISTSRISSQVRSAKILQKIDGEIIFKLPREGGGGGVKIALGKVNIISKLILFFYHMKKLIFLRGIKYLVVDIDPNRWIWYLELT